MRVRLWASWLGPDGWVPAGEEIEVSPEDAAAIGQSGQGEIVRDSEIAAVAVAEHAVALAKRSPKRRTRKRSR